MPPLAILRMTLDGVGRDCPSFLYSPAFSLVVGLKYKINHFSIRDEETQFWDQLSISVNAIKLGAVFGIRK